MALLASCTVPVNRVPGIAAAIVVVALLIPVLTDRSVTVTCVCGSAVVMLIGIEVAG